MLELGELAEIVDRFHAMCKQTIDIRPEAMTTVRECCDAPSQRNLPTEFMARQRLRPLGKRSIFITWRSNL